MPLRPLPYHEIQRKLRAAGFSEAAQRGSHVKFARTDPEGVRTAVVPRHREVAVGTLRSILRQAGLTIEEFEAL
jgi:predicted RNA binding protein YcfA (HicA-like mRNA interferase family)